MNWKKEALEWLVPLFCAALLAWFTNSFLIVNAVIPSASMEDTIMTGDRIIGNRLAYLSKEPKRGDIIIFRYPDDENVIFIKRVVGLPGETLEIRDGQVYLDGSDTPLLEPYLKEIPTGDFAAVTVPEGGYFVMGDNRNRSLDARYWTNTFVSRKQILGKAVLGYWPKIQKIE